jgi:hypothetical protein
MARRRGAPRHCGKSQPLLAWSLAGRCRGRSTPWRVGGTASISSSKMRLSWMFAAVSRRANGMPSRSVMAWRLDPARPRSVGLGLVFPPPPRRARRRCPRKPGSDRWRRPDPGDRAGRDRAFPKYRPCRSRSRRQPVIPAAHLPGQHLPGNTALQRKHNAARRRPARDRRPAAFRFDRSGGGSGSIGVHNSSAARGLATHPGTARPHRRPGCVGRS